MPPSLSFNEPNMVSQYYMNVSGRAHLLFTSNTSYTQACFSAWGLVNDAAYWRRPLCSWDTPTPSLSHTHSRLSAALSAGYLSTVSTLHFLFTPLGQMSEPINTFPGLSRAHGCKVDCNIVRHSTKR